MNTRLSLRRCVLLLGAASWAVLPISLYAGPGGAHGGGGSHGGGSHGGGVHASTSSGGGHYSGGSAHSGGAGYSHSNGRISASTGGGYYGHPASRSVNSEARAGGSGYNSLSSFVASSDANPAHLAANNSALVRMAGHGWSFLPSAGIPRPVRAAHPAVRPVPVRSNFYPAAHPPHSHPPHQPPPYATTSIYPWWGYGGGCGFNGFTSYCRPGPYAYNYSGLNYCLSGFGFWNCGYGLGYGGYGSGYGYVDGAYGPAPGYDAESSAPADSGPGASAAPEDEGDTSNMYMGPLDLAPGSVEPEAAAPRLPPAQIILKNGSAYEVAAYWVSNNELYYRPVTGGLNHVPLAQLDLSATVEANSRNGVTFSLTARPPQP